MNRTLSALFPFNASFRDQRTRLKSFISQMPEYFLLWSMTLICSLFSSGIYADLAMGQPLPEVRIQSSGELILLNNDSSPVENSRASENSQIQYQPWDSKQLTGKVYLIQHIAGRSSAKEMNAPLIEQIKKAALPKGQYQTVTLVNNDDAIWGTRGFVQGKLESSKKTYPWSMMVLDDEGSARNVWSLSEKSSAIIVLDQQGIIRWIRDGSLNRQEQADVLSLIRQLIAR